MKRSIRHTNDRTFDIEYEEFLPVFDGFGEGVIIVDRKMKAHGIKQSNSVLIDASCPA